MLHGGAAEDKDFIVCPGGKGLSISRGDTVYIRR